MLGLNREPAAIIGVVVTIVLGAVGTLVGEGIISDALGGRITDGVRSLSELATLLAPAIAGLLIRFKAYAPQTVADITGRDVNNLPPPP